MANVLAEEKKQQVLALGRLGWPLRRIEEATGIRRETASKYLKEAGIMPRRGRPSSKPAISVSTDSEPEKPASAASTGSDPPPKPAILVCTDSGAPEPAISTAASSPDSTPAHSPTASACEPYREVIELAVAAGRNAKAIWQDLVDDYGFKARYASVKRFAVKLRGRAAPEAHPVIRTPPGEDYERTDTMLSLGKTTPATPRILPVSNRGRAASLRIAATRVTTTSRPQGRYLGAASSARADEVSL